MTATEQPTPDEIRRVHQADCAVHGHRWAIIGSTESDLPLGLTCTYCGRNARVVDPEK